MKPTTAKEARTYKQRVQRIDNGQGVPAESVVSAACDRLQLVMWERVLHVIMITMREHLSHFLPNSCSMLVHATDAVLHRDERRESRDDARSDKEQGHG